MEWRCVRCDQTALADDWMLLEAIGWKRTADEECVCVLCVRKPSALARFASLAPLSRFLRAQSR